MKKVFLLFPFLLFRQTSKITPDSILINLKFKVLDKRVFLNDTVYYTKNKSVIRISKDSIFIMNKHQYLKLKR